MAHEQAHAAPQPVLSPEVRRSVEQWVVSRLNRIHQAADFIGGPNSNVEAVFPKPPEVRRDAPEPNWTPAQVEKARETAEVFGYGAEHDVKTGLTRGKKAGEGGLAWKVAAEIEAIKGEADSTSAIILMGASFRKLQENDDKKELTFLRDKRGIAMTTEHTEHDMVLALASQLVEGEPEEVVLPYGYEVAPENRTLYEETGQLVEVGHTAAGQSVQVLRVDQNFRDGKPEDRPDTAAIMGFLADVSAHEGDPAASIGLVTSNAYASRAIDMVRAGLLRSNQFGVGMYGRQTLADVTGEPMKAETPLNQLPGDLWSAYDKLHAIGRLLGMRLVPHERSQGGDTASSSSSGESFDYGGPWDGHGLDENGRGWGAGGIWYDDWSDPGTYPE